MPGTVTDATIGRLRQFLLVMISRATTLASTAGNARSAAMASHAATSAEIRQAIRPSSHNPASRASGIPRMGSRLVQFGDRGEQEAGDRSHHEAQEHFMDMPAERIEPTWQRRPRREHDDPERERCRRPESGCEKERPKALGQEYRRPPTGDATDSATHCAPPITSGTALAPGMKRATKRGNSGRSLTIKSQAINKAPSAKTMSPGIRIHSQNSVVL
jgi:hypothetical protein